MFVITKIVFIYSLNIFRNTHVKYAQNNFVLEDLTNYISQNHPEDYSNLVDTKKRTHTSICNNLAKNKLAIYLLIKSELPSEINNQVVVVIINVTYKLAETQSCP